MIYIALHIIGFFYRWSDFFYLQGGKKVVVLVISGILQPMLVKVSRTLCFKVFVTNNNILGTLVNENFQLNV